MKSNLTALIQTAIDQLKQQQVLAADNTPTILLSRTKDKSHGDYACNIAMMLSKAASKPPRELAEQIITALPADDCLEKVEIAGPGFINFFIKAGAANQIIATILQQADTFGRATLGQGKRIIIEYVSANPTGPLHVGHGRGAAYGQALADLLSAAGYEVEREYYVNDAGRQMDILAISVWLRYLQIAHIDDVTFPSNAYQGDYIRDIAQALLTEHGHAFAKPAAAVFAGLPADADNGGDQEIYIDALITRTKSLLSQADYKIVFGAALDGILNDIRDDLSEFGVVYQQWFSEYSLVDDKTVQYCIAQLQQNDVLYQQGGALWFRSTSYGDEKDRVVQRENGQMTYFASDIAYHYNKIQRGFDHLINIWGADHHGYIARVKAAMRALEESDDKLEIQLVQFANLYRGEEKVSMSTRSGEFVTLRELRNEVGNDATRFFYAMRKSEQHMDFDLELAKSQSNDNPVYYVQYAHARICNVFDKARQQNMTVNIEAGLASLELLNTEHEQDLIKKLAQYPDIIVSAAKAREPHQVIYYLRELANQFHSYYNAHQFIVEDSHLCNARMALISATKQVLINALTIIGVSAPENM